MKIGQLASFLDDGMPENMRASLAQLQQDAPPMSVELAAGVIQAKRAPRLTGSSPNGIRSHRRGLHRSGASSDYS